MTSTDLVVVLPGIMGSTLARNGKLVWAPSAGAVLRAIGTFGRSITDLRLPDGLGDDNPGDGVEAVALMPDLHALPGIWTPVRGYDLLLRRLRTLGYHQAEDQPDAPPGNLLPVPYDWRLSNRHTARLLATTVEPALERWRAQRGRYADAQLVFVCHSMGGLVARWYIEKCGGAAHTRKLITLGTPYRGAVKALEQLVNGVPSAIGPLAERLTDFARSLPALHQLLPAYACLEHDGDLATTTETTIPELTTRQVADAMRFHTDLVTAEQQRPGSATMTHAIIGTQQPTPTTARLSAGRIGAGRITSLGTYQGEDLLGDATVPLPGAARAGLPLDSNTLRRITDKHGNLQRNKAALDELEGILTATDRIPRAPGAIDPHVTVPELLLAGQQLPVHITVPDTTRHAIKITITNETDRPIATRTPRHTRGTISTTIDGLAPGAYTVTVSGLTPGSPVAPVSSDVLIWHDETVRETEARP